jgi:hypothetical protein
MQERRGCAAVNPTKIEDSIMANVEPTKEVKLTLTEEQKKQLKQQTGQDASAISFSVEELEERVTPRMAI